MDPTEEEEQADECSPDGAGMKEERGVGVVEERGAGVEEEWGTGVEVHAEDVEEGVRWWADMEEGTRWRVDAEEEQEPVGVGKWQD
jgi:hypothetical protein